MGVEKEEGEVVSSRTTEQQTNQGFYGMRTQGEEAGGGDGGGGRERK